MADYRLLVLSSPVPGQDQAYNEWYTQVHVRDLLKVPGVRTAQRFRVLQALSRNAPCDYVAEYEIDSPDIDATIADVRSRLGTPAMPMSEAFDRSSSMFIVVRPATPLVHSSTPSQAGECAVSFVLSNPVQGQETDYRTWYDGAHIRDLLRVPGYRCGQRHDVVASASRGARHQAVARYEIEVREVAQTMAEARRRLGTDDMVLSPSFDMATACFCLTEAITDKLTA